MPIIAPNLQLNAGVHRSPHQHRGLSNLPQTCLKPSWALQPTCVKPDPACTVQSFSFYALPGLVTCV